MKPVYILLFVLIAAIALLGLRKGGFENFKYLSLNSSAPGLALGAEPSSQCVSDQLHCQLSDGKSGTCNSGRCYPSSAIDYSKYPGEVYTKLVDFDGGYGH